MILKKFDDVDLLEFGNNLEIQGMIFGNGKKNYFVPFESDALDNTELFLLKLNEEEYKKLIFQLDTLETLVNVVDERGKLQKIAFRKSQRQIDNNIQWNVFRRDNYTCQYCGKNNIPLTVDHIITWENMGQTVEDNLISSCKKCNKTRGNMEFGDWLESEYYKKVNKGLDPLDFRNRQKFSDAKLLPLRENKRSR